VRTLLTTPRAVRDARREAADLCHAHGIDGDRSDSIAVVLSELLGNALLHGAPPVYYNLCVDGRDVLIEVNDTHYVLPERAALADPAGENGRGMFIVASLARGWGSHLTPNGKQVWARL
jgi:anti-sigma regulatory factor (Ser/Thr protein kinase)